MALVGVSITKRATFRDSTQEWNNVYHYSYTGLNPGATLAEAIIDNIVPIERLVHSLDTSFVHARCWSAGGSIEDNQMIFQKALAVAGTLTNATYLDRERAILIQWPAGLDSRGKPVYLRKWYHTGAVAIAGTTISDAVVKQTTSLGSAHRSAIYALVDELPDLTVNAQGMSLVAESGREITGDGFCHRYLEHHQLGDMWRG